MQNAELCKMVSQRRQSVPQDRKFPDESSCSKVPSYFLNFNHFHINHLQITGFPNCTTPSKVNDLGITYFGRLEVAPRGCRTVYVN